MRYQTLKAWMDVKAGGAKSLLVIFALTLGLWGLGSVLVSYRILSNDLRDNFLGTSPVHAVVTLKEPGQLNLEALRARADIESAECRDLAMLRVEVHPNEWIPLWLFGVEDFRHAQLARVTSQEGAPVPTPGAILIERNGRLISTLDTGRIAQVRHGDRKLEVRIDGVVFDPAQAPSTQDHFIYAYTDSQTYAQISGEAPGKRLIVRFKNVHSKAEVEEAVANLRATWGKEGPAVATVVVPAFLKHPHQWQLDMLLAIIGTIGLVAFLMSSVLVSQVVAALLAKQVRQIGILKAIGATRYQVIGIYALNLLFYAGASGLVAIPLAVITGYAFSTFCAGILNFEILTTHLPLGVWVLLILASLVLPFLFAGPTLVRAGRISVREAIGETRLALRARISARMMMTVAATTLGVAIFSTGFNIRESLFQFLASTRGSMRHDVQVVLTQPMNAEAFGKAFVGVPNIEHTEAWNGGRGLLQTRVAGTDQGIGIVSLPPDSKMVALKMVDGRWLQPSLEPEVVLNQAALSSFNVPKIGQRLTVGLGGKDRMLTLVGVAEEIDVPKIYLTDTFYDQWVNPEHQVNSLMFSAQEKNFKSVVTLKKNIERAIQASDLKVLYVLSQAERTKIIADHLNIILVVFLILAFLVLWVSALGMASATSITVLERTREIGVLRAIGATPERIIQMFVAEGMKASLTGLGLGLILSLPLSRVASSFFGTLMLGEGAVLRFAFSFSGLGITVITSILFGYLANRLPARAAVRISTREALAYE